MNKIKFSIFFLILDLCSCVTQAPKQVSIQDGIRCKLPGPKVVSNSNSPQRAIASDVPTQSASQACDLLFGQ